MRTNSLLFASLVIIVSASCDNIGVGTEPDNAFMIAAAKAYYEDAMVYQPSEPANYDLAQLAQRRLQTGPQHKCCSTRMADRWSRHN